MTLPAIKVEQLSKKFIISHESQERYTSLRDVIANQAKRLTRRTRKGGSGPAKEEFFALNDINFEIFPGDRVGIIGRNGAGKSTLLKVLSRITEPSSGRITIRGRVASLLEVGTGFHPELTGRENIFLNGAILGMARSEIKRKFDEIVDFAEIEKFLDTPVKRYSSGMYVRLAFAVAAHLEPEILIVDEVLAVGDAQFQKKCLGKMEDVSKNEGRTVLFVSHNMNIIKTLCNKSILFAGGKLIKSGSSSEIVKSYLDFGDHGDKVYTHKMGGKELRINNVEINGSKAATVALLSQLIFKIDFEASSFSGDCEFFILIYNDEGVCVQGIFQTDTGQYAAVRSGAGSIKVTLDNNLVPGKYYVSVGAFDRFKSFLDWVELCESFEVQSVYDDGRIFRERLGLSLGRATWEA
ncbi:ABC transporter ATP-binding protein [Flavitalea sp. BT771]|uniref:ABC transporter ATP-binding protein n=1 Tax=Flavitalea sp. BT771 TaxID=3063329 RepID=UPI0026E35556|nr:ABC transporter ATP-binding protein [Flavitalea sp. BT771]MDO6434164.1 ABC transporter ATP-binding protein [Flavitalea sp. BT771]MDV6223064.1 ABC transporter ATP-binding protein [Flavitalea sp. BT771]